MRKVEFANGEFYHVYNRGTDKRTIFEEDADLARFMEGMQDFNAEEPIGSIHEHRFLKKQLGSLASKLGSGKPLVRLIAYCLNPNHYHFLIEQLEDDGISKFMHRISTGYTKYFNKKYLRRGPLFSGPFKAIHVDSNEYLLRLSAYINLNDRIHFLDQNSASVKSRSSWGIYVGADTNKLLGNTDIILSQFSDTQSYKSFALEALDEIMSNKASLHELKELTEY